ncbi:MAG TPA: hypothetical protein DCL42_04950 [Deltaproteobacteria bacterium]|nr:hypothetical protein [Deltaproteobacteria bacterium]
MEGPSVNTIANSTGVIEIPVASEAVVYTPAINLKHGEFFAIAYKATSDGAVKLKLEWEQCHVEPTSEAADVRSVVPVGFSDIVSALADEIWHVAKLEPVALPYGRFKITGLADPLGNDASTTIQIKIGILGDPYMEGPHIREVLTSAEATPLSIGAGATVYSKSFSLKYGLYFALAYKAASAGAIDLTIQLEQSHELPTAEGESDAKYVIPASLGDIHTNLTDADWHNASFSPVALPYGRFRITNAAGVTNTLTAKLSIQEVIG